ncbi:MAG: aminotransferase class V-fold PLP-dependent enzyme [Planctomycetota bacterium]
MVRLLDPGSERLFLNHGSYGAVPGEILERQQDYRDRMEREPVDFMQRQVGRLTGKARAIVAQFLNADPDGPVLVRNATEGVNAVLRSLAFAPGDELVITSHGYNACNNVLRQVALQAQAKVVEVPIPFPIAGPEVVTRAIEAALTERTRLVLVDHITSPTGILFPVADIVALLRARGVLSLIDVAHAPGMVPLDLKALDADFYVGNGHKWMCAPKSVAILQVREEHRDHILPTNISHGWNTPRKGHTRLQDQFDWPGTMDPSPIFCLADMIDWLPRIFPGGWPAAMERNHKLALYGRDLLCEALGVAAPAPDSMLGCLAAVPLPPAPADFQPSAFTPDPLHKNLWENHRIEVPVIHYGGKPGRFLRISAHLHNGPEDYTRLVAALQQELALVP